MTENTVSHRATRFEDPLARSADAALAEAFGRPFDLWEPTDGWRLLGDADEPQATRLAGAEERSRLGDALTDIVTANDDPRVLAWSAGSLLAVPVRRTGQAELVATATFDDLDETVLLRLARLFVREFAQREELERLSHENETFALQISDHFEDINFLRRLTEHLGISKVSVDLIQVAQTVLPLLADWLKAESVVLLGARAGISGETAVAVDRPQYRTGRALLDDDRCSRLVERHRAACMARPVVKNGYNQRPEGAEVPGVHSFILVPIVKGDRVMGWLLALNRVRDPAGVPEDDRWDTNYNEFGTNEAILLSSAASVFASHACNVELFREKEKLLTNVVRALVSAVEAKDAYTCGHSERVGLFGKRLGRQLGLTPEACERLYLTGLLHDVGKIGISDATLNKPARLTREEFEEIKRHPDKGWAILHDLDQLKYVLPGVLYHHERYDGDGYPDGLAGERIPLDGRILAIADSYDAMTSDRPYRQGMPQERAEEILRGGAGAQWDPQLVEAFFAAMPDIVRIRETYRPHPQHHRERGSV